MTNNKKLLRFWLATNTFMWLATIFVAVATNQNIRIIACIIALGCFVVTIIFGISLDWIFPKKWCEDMDDIDDLRAEAESELKKAEKFVAIIGTHEAIKLYEEKKAQPIEEVKNNKF
jgi:hypothetical protein